eukprot:3555867-Rhodomonas_salina.5
MHCAGTRSGAAADIRKCDRWQNSYGGDAQSPIYFNCRPTLRGAGLLPGHGAGGNQLAQLSESGQLEGDEVAGDLTRVHFAGSFSSQTGKFAGGLCWSVHHRLGLTEDVSKETTFSTLLS